MLTAMPESSAYLFFERVPHIQFRTFVVATAESRSVSCRVNRVAATGRVAHGETFGEDVETQVTWKHKHDVARKHLHRYAAFSRVAWTGSQAGRLPHSEMLKRLGRRLRD